MKQISQKWTIYSEWLGWFLLLIVALTCIPLVSTILLEKDLFEPLYLLYIWPQILFFFPNEWLGVLINSILYSLFLTVHMLGWQSAIKSGKKNIKIYLFIPFALHLLLFLFLLKGIQNMASV